MAGHNMVFLTLFVDGTFLNLCYNIFYAGLYMCH